jgi:hypothetical protein
MGCGARRGKQHSQACYQRYERRPLQRIHAY